MFNGKKRMVEVWTSLKGVDAVELGNIIRKFGVRYHRVNKDFTYYRLRITRKDVRALTRKLEKEGYNTVVLDNKYFQVFARNERIA